MGETTDHAAALTRAVVRSAVGHGTSVDFAMASPGWWCMSTAPRGDLVDVPERGPASCAVLAAAEALLADVATATDADPEDLFLTFSVPAQRVEVFRDDENLCAFDVFQTPRSADDLVTWATAPLTGGAQMRRERLAREVWAAVPTPAIAWLAALRLAVLERGDTRCPKWKFRLAPDVIVEVQPRPVPLVPPELLARPDLVARGLEQRALAFACVAFVGDAASASWFTDAPAAGDWSKVRFSLYARAADPSTWLAKAASIGWSRSAARDAGFLAVVWAALRTLEGREVPRALMLVPHCLICGRALTDPASMARWIGPECAGTASVSVPRLFAPGGGA